MAWLSFEVGGYPTPLTVDATTAARRSNRVVSDEETEDDSEKVITGTLGQMGVLRESAKERITVASALPVERNEAQTSPLFLPSSYSVATSHHACSTRAVRSRSASPNPA
jgi:hypothetical protein